MVLEALILTFGFDLLETGSPFPIRQLAFCNCFVEIFFANPCFHFSNNEVMEGMENEPDNDFHHKFFINFKVELPQVCS